MLILGWGHRKCEFVHMLILMGGHHTFKCVQMLLIESKTEPSVVKVQNYIAGFPSMGGGGDPPHLTLVPPHGVL